MGRETERPPFYYDIIYMIALLTTKTTHHIYFENQIFKKFKNIINICETSMIIPKFPTDVHFEKKRDIYEKKTFFKSKKKNFRSKSYIVKNINEKKVIKILKDNNVSHIIVFGTRKIDKKIIKEYKNNIFNLHGGNPEEFRGLDSHYWSIYLNNFNLYSCLHKLNNKLDDGDIIFKKKIKLNKGMKIHQLRAANTLCCISMVLKLIKLIQNKRKIPLNKQKTVGRYYSFMPKEIKKIVEKKFVIRK